MCRYVPGGNIAIQGVFQALGCGISSLVISLLRLFVIVLTLAYVFTLFTNATDIMWLAFPIAELVALIVAIALLKRAKDKVLVIL